jgi:hypothetical protein
MIYPKPSHCKNCLEFLTKLFELNKKKNKNFSYSNISTSLKWPPSLIPDLIKDRRKLSLQRALELGSWLNLDVIELEYLVMLCLRDSPVGIVEDYFNKKISEDLDASHPKRGESIQDTNLSILDMAVLSVISWKKGRVKREEIVTCLKIFPDFKSENCEKSIDNLISEKFISKLDNSTFQILNDDPTRQSWGIDTPEMKERYDQYSQVLSNFFQHMYFPYSINSALILLPVDRRKEIFEKFMITKNWLYNISDELKKTKSLDDTLVFQLNMHLFPIVSQHDKSN